MLDYTYIRGTLPRARYDKWFFMDFYQIRYKKGAENQIHLNNDKQERNGLEKICDLAEIKGKMIEKKNTIFFEKAKVEVIYGLLIAH